MQQVDDPPSLPVGTEVSAKYKGAFCEAKVSKVVRNIKVKVAYKQGLGSGIVSDELIKAAPGQLRVGATVEVRHPDRKDPVEATVTKIQDCSQYTVVFDDGDITTLRRTALCLKSGRHFNESETLDQLPLTHPEHFGNPVVGGRRGRRRGHLNEDSSEEEEESESKEVVNEKEENIGKVVCVEIETKKKDKEKFFPGLVVAPTAQATVRIRVKDDYLVRSFKDGRYYTVPKKEATEFTREAAIKQDSAAVQAALEFLDNNVLPAHWDRDTLFGLRNSSSDDEGEVDSDSSDDEPREEKDRFVAQLYKYMDDRGTPLNKVPTIQNRDVDLYRLFRAVQKRGGYNRVTSQNQWKSVATRLGFTPVTTGVSNMVKQSFKKFLQPYGDFNRKLGCSMLMTPRNSSRTKGRSLVRAISVASPKPTVEPVVTKEPVAAVSKPSEAIAVKSVVVSTPTPTAISSVSTPPPTVSSSSSSSTTTTTAIVVPAASVNDESENTSESSQDLVKNRRKATGGSSASSSSGKVKILVEKYEEKTTSAVIATALSTSNTKDEGDLPLSKIKAAAVASNALRFLEEKEARERESSIIKDVSISSKDSARSGSTPATRDPSPAGSVASTTTSIRKDKPQRKSIPTTAAPSVEERRNKRKKDEVSVEKVDVGDFIVEVGDKLKVYYHEKKVTYEAKVIEITLQRGIPMYMVHYTGWNNRYDEWVPRERIAENLSKSYKNKKGPHFDRHGEKNKENPPKPPSSAALAADLQNSLSGSALSSTSIMAAVTKAATTTTISKRGRGRSESARTRSVTPSSVASNSGRTQSISHTVSKHRRSVRTGGRRVSITASDMSLQTESETDSDEPVKPRSTRASKDTIYKPHPTSSKKLSAMAKPKTGSRSSAVNSQSETGDDADDDEEDGPANSLCSLASSATSSAGSTQKGRDYDLNQIRSELKGFKVLKSPSPSASSAPVDEQTTVMTDKQVSVDKIKDETLDEATTTTTTLTTPSSSLQVAQSGTEGTKMTITTATSSKNTPTQTSTASSSVVELNKSELIKKEKLEVDILPKSTTDISSETDSYADDDSQSSDRTTQLQNMTKKFQQKINADKQRIRGKNLLLSDGSAIKSEQNVINPKTRIVEKILKDSLAEKRQESLKNKPSVLTLVKEETRLINRKDNKETNTKPNLKLGDAEQAIDDIKVTTSRFTSLTTNTTQPQPTVTANTASTANVSTSSNTTSSSKYSSVIVDKPLNIGKKIDTAKGSTMFKKTMEKALITETLQNIVTTSGAKDFLKIEPPAAASPTSSTSSISSHISSNSSRSIPDMSKLDISSPSSSSSSFKDVKATSNALMPIKPTSPDIYEFKDNEPFEFQIRKLPLSAASAGVGNNNNLISHVSSSVSSGPNLAYGIPLSARRQSYKPGTSAAAAAAANADSSNFVPTLLGRKKRGSPFKDITTASDKLKQSKLDDKSSVIVPTTSSNLVADAKLLHHVMPTVSPPNSSKSSICTASKLSVGTSGFSTTTSSPIMPITTPTIITTTTPPTQTALTAATSSAVCVTPTIIKSSTLTAVSTPMPTTNFVAATTTTTPTTATSLATTSAFSPAQKSANAFDVLRKSPSFNLINALNEEIAQTVQETTGALTDVAMPVTPSTPPIVMDMLPLPSKTSATTTKEIISTTPTTTTTSMVVVTPVTSSVPKESEVSSTRQSPVTPKIMNSSTVTTTTTTINTPTSTKPSVGVGSPFMETKKNLSNVFEMCAYEGATTSVGGNRDTKFGLEKAKFLLSATVGGGFDFEPTLKTEHKPISIADKLLKAISQKKEEENKIKEHKAPEIGTTSSPSTSATQWPVKPLSLTDSLPNTDASNTLPALCSTPTNSSVDVATMPFVPPISSTKPLNSPEPTKLNLLEANAAKNTDLNETIQKLECAIQRKTCASLKTVATAALPFSSSPNTSVPTVMPSPAANFSEESIDSTDSERRLVIEDVSDDLPKSPIVMLKNQSTPTPRARSVDVTASMQQQLRHSPVVNSPIVMAHASNVSATGELQNTVCISVPEIPVSVVMAPIATGSSVLSKHKPMPLHLTTKSEISGTATTITTTTKNNLHVYSPLVTTNVAASATPTTSGFFSNSRTALRPEDGVKPISDMLLHAVSAQADAERAKEEIEQAALIANAAAIASGSSGGVSVGVGESHQHDSINLLCEETIPGSPAPVINKDEIPLAAASPARTSLIAATTITTAQQQQQQQQQQIDNESQVESNPADKMSANDNMMQIKQQQQQHQSSPNDSCSQDESQDDDAKKTQSEHDFGQCKRRRTRKTSERDGQSLQQQQQIQTDGSLKRRRTLTHKKHNQGSDSDENSDTLALRSANISTRQQQMQQQQQQFQVLQQPQLADQIGVATGLRPCPYNFLVQLDPTLSSDQCIAILLKQIQELRKTYNNIKGDLAAIDRRRKKIRRRNREKKQNQQINPQPAQLMKVSATT